MARPPNNLSTAKRNLIVQFILQHSVAGKPQYGRLLRAQNKFQCSKSIVHRLWKDAKQQQEQELAIHSSSKIKGKKGRPTIEPNYERIKALTIDARSSFRKMEVELEVSKATLSRWYNLGYLRAHTSALKPSLTADNKFMRLRFSLESLELDTIMNRLRYSSMHNIVHIDEKWFYVTKGTKRYYLTPDEEEPYRACKSKKFIGKIMFMCAVTRPMLRDNGSVLFDGKIGIFPFTHQVPAVRGSKNRPKGTLETKSVDHITRAIIKSTIINKVPTCFYSDLSILTCIIGHFSFYMYACDIGEKWPEGASKQIIIHQDNAKPHIMNNDADFREAVTTEGFNMRLVQQPPNSPDTNINDLGFFNAIQAIQHQKACKNIDDLVNAVKQAFYELAPSTLNKVFLTLQGCLTEIMKGKGHNKYKIPHMGKDMMIREDTLPISPHVPIELAKESIDYLIENGQIRGIEHLVHRLGLQQLTGIEGDGGITNDA